MVIIDTGKELVVKSLDHRHLSMVGKIPLDTILIYQFVSLLLVANALSNKNSGGKYSTDSLFTGLGLEFAQLIVLYPV